MVWLGDQFSELGIGHDHFSRINTNAAQSFAIELLREMFAHGIEVMNATHRIDNVTANMQSICMPSEREQFRPIVC